MYRAFTAIEVNAAFKKEAKQARDTQTSSIYFQCKTPLSALGQLPNTKIPLKARKCQLM